MVVLYFGVGTNFNVSRVDAPDSTRNRLQISKFFAQPIFSMEYNLPQDNLKLNIINEWHLNKFKKSI